MAKTVRIGISDIAIYLPRLKIELSTVVEKRIREGGGDQLERILKRALEKTGAISLHFPEAWEDPVTMAAEAALRLLERGRVQLRFLRYLATGTESGVDHSKPLAAYVIGLLKKAGFAIPQSLSVFQTQHACAGGTVALLGVSALLGFAPTAEECGLVVCSDVARYEKATSAEVTQGAGAVALVVEKNPKLIELELGTAGYSSRDVDDFFRPLGSDVAKVKGAHSIRCYMEAMESALLDHAEREGVAPDVVLSSADMIALHVPYPKLPYDAMIKLLGKYNALDAQSADAFLNERGFHAMIDPASRSGNIYTGSLYLSLAFLLKERFERFGRAIVGKKILLGSYGSGNTMVFISGRVAEKAPEIIESWNFEEIWKSTPATIDEYENWIARVSGSVSDFQIDLAAEQGLPNFYLSGIREDGYREYEHQK